MLEIKEPESVEMLVGAKGATFHDQQDAQDSLLLEAFCDWYSAGRTADLLVTDDGDCPSPHSVVDWLLGHKETVIQFYEAAAKGNLRVPVKR